MGLSRRPEGGARSAPFGRRGIEGPVRARAADGPRRTKKGGAVGAALRLWPRRAARYACWIAESFQRPPTGRTNVQISVVSVGSSLPSTIAPVCRSRITSTLS